MTMVVHQVATPILGEETSLDVAVEAGVWPIDDLRHKAVFDWIVVDVVNMPFKISIISDRVLPITSVPNALFALRYFAGRT